MSRGGCSTLHGVNPNYKKPRFCNEFDKKDVKSSRNVVVEVETLAKTWTIFYGNH